MSKLKWPTKQGKSFQIPLFGGTMWVFFDRESYKTALQVINYRPELDLEIYGGLVTHITHPENGSIYIVGIFSHTLGIVCHECVHVAQYAMSYVGSRDDETEAYLTQRCFEFIEKHMPKGETNV